jgi:hypothetical protein
MIMLKIVNSNVSCYFSLSLQELEKNKPLFF